MLTRRALLPSLLAISAAAREARAAKIFKVLTADEAADIESIAAEIIPTDDTPGAREAGVIWFIDSALAADHADQQQVVRTGLAQLRGAVRSPGFAALDAARKQELLRSIESTEFFKTIRTLTVMGFLADPRYGGNRDHIGWNTIGFSHAHVHRPPFGHYDK